MCSETLIGNDQIRGVSGGQRKRVTTGELLVSPKKTLFLDEISTGLDSATTFQIMRTLRHFAHLRQATMLIALLQPTPETYHLFDDIMLLSEGELSSANQIASPCMIMNLVMECILGLLWLGAHCFSGPVVFSIPDTTGPEQTRSALHLTKR